MSVYVDDVEVGTVEPSPLSVWVWFGLALGVIAIVVAIISFARGR